MNKSRIKIFHNQYRQIFYKPFSATLIVHWYGQIPDDEQLHHIELLQEILKIYSVEHIEIHTKKARFASLKPVRVFIEKVLKKVYDQGGKTITIVQRPIKNQLFVINAYINALRGLGINMEFRMVTI